MNLPTLSGCVVVLALGLMAARAPQSSDTARPAKSRTTVTAHATTAQAEPGDRVFANNCSRCHAAPMSLSPRITGTVIMHMRTRARLSQRDEQLLLKFLAP
jgi:cytochrome c5